MPSTARPLEMRLTLVIAVAVAAAWRVTELVTPVPRPMRVVAVAGQRQRDIGIAGEVLQIDHQHAVPTGRLDLLRGARTAARRSDAGGPQLHVPPLLGLFGDWHDLRLRTVLLNVNSLNMSWKRRAERAYHHGNLREALIQAARELIKEKGPAGLHLRRRRALGRRQRGGALSPFPRPRGAAGRRGARGLRALRGDAVDRLGRRQARPAHRLRQCRQGLSRLRPRRARLLRGDVRIGPAARPQRRSARGGRPRLRRAAHRRRSAGGACCRPASGRRR